MKLKIGLIAACLLASVSRAAPPANAIAFQQNNAGGTGFGEVDVVPTTGGILTFNGTLQPIPGLIAGTSGQVTVNYSTGTFTFGLPAALTGINSVTSVAGQNLVLSTGTFGTSLTFASATGIGTFAVAPVVPGLTVNAGGITSSGTVTVNGGGMDLTGQANIDVLDLTGSIASTPFTISSVITSAFSTDSEFNDPFFVATANSKTFIVSHLAGAMGAGVQTGTLLYMDQIDTPNISSGSLGGGGMLNIKAPAANMTFALNVTSGNSIFGGPIFDKMTTLTYASPTSVDPTTGNSFKVTTINATGSVTFNSTTGGTAGQHMWIYIVNDATSGKVITFGSNFDASGTLTGNTTHTGSTIEFLSDGTAWREIARTVGTL